MPVHMSQRAPDYDAHVGVVLYRTVLHVTQRRCRELQIGRDVWAMPAQLLAWHSRLSLTVAILQAFDFGLDFFTGLTGCT